MQENNNFQIYKSRINSLKEELTINYGLVNKNILSGKEDFLKETKIPAYNYITLSINRVLEDDIITDDGLRINMFEIAQNENSANRMLDSLTLLFHEHSTSKMNKINLEYWKI